MALPAYLSAIRELILDEGIVGPASQRRTVLAQRFPELRASEVDDLAAIPPERFQVYTDLVFAGERSTIEYAFPVTLAAIHRLRSAMGDDRPARLADFELVRELHRWRAWRSSSHRELAANFAAFILDQRASWHRAWGGLADLMDFERTDLEVFYTEDPPYERVTAKKRVEFAKRTVESLLATQVVMPSYAALRSYGFDVPAMAAAWRRDGVLPDPLPMAAPGTSDWRFICGRDTESLMPRWHRLDESCYAVLAGLARDVPVCVNDLANQFLTCWPDTSGKTEEALFADFFERLVVWFQTGLLLCPTSD